MNTNQTRKTELLRVSEYLNSWKVILKKEKSIYETMNHFNFDNSRQTMIAEGWCPTPDISAIQMAFRAVTVGLSCLEFSSFPAQPCYRSALAPKSLPF
jgi:V-type H+-transporting ATPase subunit a